MLGKPEKKPLKYVNVSPLLCPTCGSKEHRVYSTRYDERLRTRFRYSKCPCGQNFVQREVDVDKSATD